MLNINHWIRQGDVIITRISDDYCKNKNIIDLNSKTLAEGEITGHSHSFTRNNDQVLIYGENNSPQLLKVKSETAMLTHQEHDKLEIPQGLYKIENERSYDYWEKSVKKTID